MRVVRRPDTPGQRFSIALAALRELDIARRRESRGLSLPAIAESQRLDPLQLEPVLDLLVEMNWIGRLDEAGAQRYVMLGDPASMRAAPLIDALLLAPSAATAAFERRAALSSLTVADLVAG